VDRQGGFKDAALFVVSRSPAAALAGLWESWSEPESGEQILSATIIIGAANR
jgi:putative SOS response-associated peptidase YedK